MVAVPLMVWHGDLRRIYKPVLPPVHALEPKPEPKPVRSTPMLPTRPRPKPAKVGIKKEKREWSNLVLLGIVLYIMAKG